MTLLYVLQSQGRCNLSRFIDEEPEAYKSSLLGLDHTVKEAELRIPVKECQASNPMLPIFLPQLTWLQCKNWCQTDSTLWLLLEITFKALPNVAVTSAVCYPLRTRHWQRGS